MEPPLFGSGNGLNEPTSLPHMNLQWSHRFSAVETGWKDGPSEDQVNPSMEPPLFGSGNWQYTLYVPLVTVPSMEPPLFGSGNMASARASMLAWLSFNGATAFRQWKLVKEHRGSVGVAYLQWSHRFSAVETSTGACTGRPTAQAFNGATAFRQWKLAWS